MLNPSAVGRGKRDGGRKGGTTLIALISVSGNCSRAETTKLDYDCAFGRFKMLQSGAALAAPAYL